MRENLLSAIKLCAHYSEIVDGEPEGWRAEDEIVLGLREGYRASIHLYLSKTNSIAFFVCKIPKEMEDLATSSKEILEKYRNKFIAQYQPSLLQLENTFLTKLQGLKLIIFTGFGIAGSLAQLYAYSYETHAIVFDSPGNKFLLENAFKQDVASGLLNSRASTLLHVFLTTPNAINTFDQQMGDTYRIKIPIITETSWAHIALALLDLVSITSNYFLIYQIFNIWRATKLANEAHEIVSRFHRKENDYQNWVNLDRLAKILLNTSCEDFIVPSNEYSVGEQLLDLALDTEVQANDNWQTSSASSIILSQISIFTSYVAHLNKTSEMKRQSPEQLLTILSSPIGVLNYKIIAMLSWPQAIEAPKSWLKTIKKLLFPTRLFYINNENSYLEATLVHSLPGYEEKALNSIAMGNNYSLMSTTSLARRQGSTLTTLALEPSHSPVIDYHAINSNLSNLSLNTLLTNIAMHPLFFTLRKLNLANNYLDDASTSILIPWFKRLTHLNLSQNRFTYWSLTVMAAALSQADTNLTELDLSENYIFFKNRETGDGSQIPAVPPGITLKLDGNTLGFETEMGRRFTYQLREERKRENTALLGYLESKITFFSSRPTSLRSLHPSVTHELSREQSLVHVIVTGDFSNQHALLLIEQLSDKFPYLRELVIFELLQEVDEVPEKGMAYINYEYPSSRHFRKRLLANPPACHPVPREIVSTKLIPNLIEDVQKGYLPYQKFASKGPDGKLQLNCAKWIAQHLNAIGVKINLSSLNLPIELVGFSEWFRAKFGL